MRQNQNSKSLLTVLVLFLFSVASVSGQKYDWSKVDGQGAHYWSTATWGSGSRDMVCDEYGNVYSIGSQYSYAGYGTGALDFGDSVYAQAGSNQYATPYMAKYNRKGVAQWATSIDATGYLWTTSLAIDTAGNSYIIGSTYNGVTSIAGQTVGSYGQGDIWLVKIKPDGVVDWAMTVGGNANDYPTGITCSANGDIYITGLFQGYFQYGNTGISGSSQGWSVFLLKLATDGSAYYCKRIATADGQSAWQSAGGDVKVDRTGRVYVSGSFTNTIQSGSGKLYAGSTQSDQNGFVMRVFPNNGTPVWATQMGSTASALAVDEQGYIYVGGKMQSSSGADSFGNAKFTNNGGLGFDDLYVSRLNNNGTIDWVKRFGDNTTTSNPSGWWWLNQRINIASMDVDYSGKIFVSGTIDRTTDSTSICQFYVPPFSATAWGGGYYQTDAFLLKISKNGSCDWNARSGTRLHTGTVYYWNEKTNGGGVATDNAGATYWKDSKSWGTSVEGDTIGLYFNNDTNVIAWETGLGYNTPVIWAIRENYIEIDSFAPKTACPGDSIRVWYTKHEVFDTTNMFYIELSNRTGVFFDAVNIGSIKDTGSGVLSGVLPLTSPEGTGYRLRVSGTAPAVRGYPFETNLTIKGVPPTNAGSDDSMCYGDTITLHASGGIDFAWFSDIFLNDSSLVDPSIYPDSTHSFILRSVDSATSCYFLDTMTMRVISQPRLIPRQDTTICQGESVWLTTTATGGKPKQYHYTWINSLDNSVVDYGDSVLVNPRLTTPYKAVLYDSCSILRDTAIVTINVRGHLKANPRSDTTLCIGESVNIYALTSGGLDSQYHYNWYVDTNLVKTDSAFTWPSQDTSITFKLVVDDGGCSDEKDSAYFTAFRRDSLRIFSRTDTTICNGQGILLNVWGTGGFSGGYTFTWDHNLPSRDSVYVVPTQQVTTYKVKLSDACTNFTDTTSINISLRFPLNLKVQSDTLICRGESMYLHVDGSGGDSLHYTFNWKNIGPGNVIKITPSQETTYTVTLTDNCTLLSTDDSFKVSLRNPLSISTSPDTTICVSNTALLRAYGTGGNSPTYEFVWSDGTTETTLPANIPYSVTPAASSTYSVRLQDNCTVINDSSTIKVTLRDPLEVSATPSDTTICHGAIATVQAVGKGGLLGNYSYHWEYVGNGAVQHVQPLIDSTFRVMISDGCSPWDTAEVKVKISTPLKVVATGDTLICPDRPIVMKAYASGGVPTNYQYTWSHGLGNGNKKAVITYTAEDYVVTLTDNCSFPSYDTVSVRLAPLPDTHFSVDLDTGCQPMEVLFSSDYFALGGYCNWFWEYETNVYESKSDPYGAHLYDAPGTFQTRLVVTSIYGCTDTSEYVPIVVHPKPVAQISFKPESSTILEPTAHIVNKTSHAYKNYWDFGDGANSQLFAPFHRYADTGHYTVLYFVESEFGCKDTAEAVYQVREIFSCYVPSGFTPNDDKLNDEFFVTGTGIYALHIKIYDRWGALIYESSDPNFHWDGTDQRSGELLPTGAYIYQLKVDLDDGGRKNLSGTISLVR
ncbi:MAG: T9SS type B sorting domain-containing protein [Bacteroidetes bacterium]|nr:T9SS type B sorting domain-containing protein [Bacteroidota bacterium]